jgi:hypothetical protein
MHVMNFISWVRNKTYGHTAHVAIYQSQCLVQVLVINICVYLTLCNAQHIAQQKLSKSVVHPIIKQLYNTLLQKNTSETDKKHFMRRAREPPRSKGHGKCDVFRASFLPALFNRIKNKKKNENSWIGLLSPLRYVPHPRAACWIR